LPKSGRPGAPERGIKGVPALEKGEDEARKSRGFTLNWEDDASGEGDLRNISEVLRGVMTADQGS